MRLPKSVTEIRGGNIGGQQYPHKDLTEKIIGCAIRVHKALRAGYVEGIYENALVHELRKTGLRVTRQVKLPVFYDGIMVGEHRADVIVEGQVVVELKAAQQLTNQHLSQIMSTMKAASVEVGLLLNFHEARLIDGLRRVVMQESNSTSSAASAPLR